MPHVRIPGPGDPWLLLQLSPPGSVPELKGRKLQLSAENKEEKTPSLSLECREREGATPSAEALTEQAFSRPAHRASSGVPLPGCSVFQHSQHAAVSLCSDMCSCRCSGQLLP